jgi:2,4-dienoyl-CoA reductase-like NADH-dependent reductase (Old Yellow Enzyme family)
MTGAAHPTGPGAAAALLAPYRLGPLALANRFAMAPMTRGHCPGGVPGEDVAAYYARRAAGGVGLIISEGIYIDHPSAGAKAAVPRLEPGRGAEGWRRVVAAVHEQGAPILAQLWHLGAERAEGDPPYPDGDVLSASGIGLAGQSHGRAATGGDIDELIAAYAASARLAVDVGFDGVEIHGAHGFLLDQFLWEATNRRTDAYGGSRTARARLSAEVVAAIVAEIGPEVPVSFRFSQWKLDRYDARIAESPAELAEVLAPIAEAGVSVFHASAHRHAEPAFEGSRLSLAGWTRKITDLPTITVGSVGLAGADDPAGTDDGGVGTAGLARLARQFAAGEFDLVALGRMLISNPDWVAKLAQGRTGELTAYDRAHLTQLA